MDGGLGELDNTTQQHLILSSSGISGDRDRARLEADLGAIEGVRDVEVDPERHTVDITFDPTVVDEVRLRTAVEDAGYRLSDQTNREEADQYQQEELNQVSLEREGEGVYPIGDPTFNPRDLPYAEREFEE